jgi:hypothetical protein
MGRAVLAIGAGSSSPGRAVSGGAVAGQQELPLTAPGLPFRRLRHGSR